MIRGLYDWTLAWAGHRHAPWALAAVAFAESSVFPIPPDLLLIPMILAAPHKAFRFAAICTIASVLGALLGYAIGYFAWETLGEPILRSLGKADAFEGFEARYNDYGAWAVLVAGVTPFPFKVITILSGMTALSLPVFLVSSIVARGLRFVIVAAILWKYGPPVRELVERRLGLFFTVATILLIGGFFAVRWL